MLLVLVCSGVASAQEILQKGHGEWAIFGAGGTGVGKRSTTQFVYGGFRYGRVLTDEHGSGWLRGNFEIKTEVIPFEAILQPGKNAYGVEFRPLMLTWNFHGNAKVRPYAQVAGGLLLTNHDVPVNTNPVNFTPQGGVGFHFLTAPRRAITFEAKYVHVSNAGLERRNTGINAAVHFTLGYTWFR